MKPSHEYYNISELIEKWSTHDNNINEMDILKWGASGQLQFSVWISTGKYYHHIDIIQEYQDGTERVQEGLLEGKEILKHISCKTVRIDSERKIWKLSKKSIEFLLDEKKQDTVFPELLPDCDECKDEKCGGKQTIKIQPTLAAWWVLAHPDYDPDVYLSRREDPQYSHLYISEEDLVVSHKDMKQFEDEYFKPETPIPPYLDPTHFAYNIELALAIETWEALFINKSHNNENYAKQAAKYYLKNEINYKGDRERYKSYAEKTDITDSSPLGRIAIMLNDGLRSKGTWKKIKQLHSDQTSEP